MFPIVDLRITDREQSWATSNKLAPQLLCFPQGQREPTRKFVDDITPRTVRCGRLCENAVLGGDSQGRAVFLPIVLNNWMSKRKP
jgi:hypothetical protein